MTALPDNALRLRVATADIGLRRLFGSIRVPTLAMHTRGEAAVAYERGRVLAEGIPKARFVTLESEKHLLREDEPAWERFVEG
ncbi:MAG: hypothetical protein AAGF92_19140 [Myxococcota bacterium]